MDEDSNLMLTIWSHAHAPPLQPPADISFDLRRVANPPKHIRDSYDGRSKRLREHLLHDPNFTDLLDSAMEEILRVAQEQEIRQASKPEDTGFVAEGETVTSSSPSAITGPSNGSASDGSDNASAEESLDDEEAQAQTASTTMEHDSDQEEPSSSPSSAGEMEAAESESSRLLRVSCFCERGRHRSVAFAEELGKMGWPRAWDVRVQHRDVEDHGRRSKKARSGRKEARRGGKRGLAFGFGPAGDDEP